MSHQNNTLHSPLADLSFFKCDCMPFGQCNAPATFQWLMKNCLGELNLIYCLIYLDDIVIFSHTAEEHLHHLCVVFNQFREHNLKLKLLKCNFIREEITYLAQSSPQKRECDPVTQTWRPLWNAHCPKIYTEVLAFLGLVGHYRRFIKGFAHIAQLLNNHLTGEGASRMSRAGVTFRGCLEGFQSIEAGVYDSSCVGLCQLYQTIPVGDWCVQGWTWGIAVPEAGGWMIPPSHLQQQSPYTSWEKLPFN